MLLHSALAESDMQYEKSKFKVTLHHQQQGHLSCHLPQPIWYQKGMECVFFSWVEALEEGVISSDVV
jgi:hypothetical protein